MARLSFSLFLIWGIILTACGYAGQESQDTPTPFPTRAPSQRITIAAPIPITLENLAANPDFFVGATLQLSGQFHRLPRLVCAGDSSSSPATWALSADGFLTNASGMDEQLRSLIDEGQQLTVEGRWLKFEGLVGCGDEASEEAIWYLSIDRVLDPNPLVRLSPTPASSGPTPTAIAQIPAATATLDNAIATETPTSAVVVSPSLTPALPSPTTILTATITPALPQVQDSTAITPTVSADSTPSLTPDSIALTVTASSITSVTPSGLTIVEKGNLPTADLRVSTLGPDSVDRWTVNLIAGDTLTVTVTPGTATNMILSVLSGDGKSIVNDQDSASLGEVETISNLSITEPGTYDILVRSEPPDQTDYAIMIMDGDSYNFIFRGRLVENTSRSDSLTANTDHFWFFNVQSGESVSISVIPDSTGDPYLDLYDPGGARMLTIDDTEEGEEESLDSHTFLEDGLYGLRIAEYDYRPMSYQVSVNKP